MNYVPSDVFISSVIVPRETNKRDLRFILIIWYSAIFYLLSWFNRQYHKRYPETHENLRIKILIRVKTTLVSIRNKTALQIFKFLYYPHYICEMFPQSTFYIVKYIKKWNKREIYLRLHINKSSQLPLFHIISMCVTNKNKECR